jgi:hypothetical protein
MSLLFSHLFSLFLVFLEAALVLIFNFFDLLKILSALHCFMDLFGGFVLLFLQLFQAVLHQSELEFDFLMLEMRGKHLDALVSLAFNHSLVNHRTEVDLFKAELRGDTLCHHWRQFQVAHCCRRSCLHTSAYTRGFPC